MTKLKKFLSQPIFKILFVLLLVLAHVFILYKAKILTILDGTDQLLDFENYLLMAEAIVKGQNPYQILKAPTLGPPLVILFYVPFSFLPRVSANQLITLLNLVSLYLTSWWLVKRTRLKRLKPIKQMIGFLVISAVILSSFPARYNLGMGQPNLIIMALISYMLLIKNKLGQVRLLLITSLIKSFYALGFLARVQTLKRNFLKVVLMGAVMLGLSLLIIKPKIYSYYFKHNFQQNISVQRLKTKTETKMDYYSQSLGSSLARFNLETIYPLVWVLIAGGLVFLVIESQNLMLGISGALLISPIVWQYYFVVLFPILILLKLRFKFKIYQYL